MFEYFKAVRKIILSSCNSFPRETWADVCSPPTGHQWQTRVTVSQKSNLVNQWVSSLGPLKGEWLVGYSPGRRWLKNSYLTEKSPLITSDDIKKVTSWPPAFNLLLCTLALPSPARMQLGGRIGGLKGQYLYHRPRNHSICSVYVSHDCGSQVTSAPW